MLTPPFPIVVAIFTEGSKDIFFANYTDTWRLHRKLAFQSLRNFLSGDHLEVAIYDSFERITSHLDNLPEETDNVRRYLQFCMYNTLSKSCFNREYEDIEDKEFVQLSSSFDEFNADLASGTIEDVFPYLMPIWKSSTFKRGEELVTGILDIVKGHIAKHKASLDEENPRDIVDHLLIAQMQIESEGTR